MKLNVCLLESGARSINMKIISDAFDLINDWNKNKESCNGDKDACLAYKLRSQRILSKLHYAWRHLHRLGNELIMNGLDDEYEHEKSMIDAAYKDVIAIDDEFAKYYEGFDDSPLDVYSGEGLGDNKPRASLSLVKNPNEIELEL